jgi:hypothetical protein
MNMQQRRLNGWRRLALMPLLLLAVLMLILAGSLVLRGTAHAQSGNSITLASSGQLIARTTVQISVTATCTVPEGTTIVESSGEVDISQASGREIVQGSGVFSPICDGKAHTFQVFVTPPAGSAPFHGGPAIASAHFFVGFVNASGTFGSVVAGTGPQTIRIRG